MVTGDGFGAGKSAVVNKILKNGLADFTAIFSVAAFTLIWIAGMSLSPREPGQAVAVIFPPWTDAKAAFERATEAGGRFVRYGAWPFVAVVAPETQSYSGNVRANGAWFVADPQKLAACLRPFQSNGAE